jgi:ribulose-phosphate 3-epimerase
VDNLVVEFAEAGASIITFHPEASIHVDRTLSLIREQGCQSGLVLNPTTPLDVLDWTMDKLDMILLMSVNPGFGGQKFIPYVMDKIRHVRGMIDASGREIRLEIDGGVTVDNIGELAAAGVDTFVSGSAIFGTEDYTATIAAMRNNIAEICS